MAEDESSDEQVGASSDAGEGETVEPETLPTGTPTDRGVVAVDGGGVYTLRPGDSIVPVHQTDPTVEAISNTIQAVFTIQAETERAKAGEETKRHADALPAHRETVRWAFGFAIAVLAFLTLALLMDQSALAEKVLIALISFGSGVVGGWGYGRRKKAP